MGSDEQICKDQEGEKTEEESPQNIKQKNLKLIRMLTVFAYLMSVSTPAVLLSIYYLFLWQSPSKKEE